MRVSCGTIRSLLEKRAPVRLAEDWDNVGLLVGEPGGSAERILLSLDITAEVIAEAVEFGANLIIAHHPFPFKPVTSIRTDRQDGAMLACLLKHDIAVYAAHTNLDSAVGGVNDALAEALGLESTTVLQPNQAALVKLAVYVPAGHEEAVWRAMTAAGAGHIGQYSQCGFRVAGTGTFLPQAGTNPFIGEPGKLERVAEVRLETVAPAVLAEDIIKAMLAVHPYEEAAYDIYPLKNACAQNGLGRVGNLPTALSLREFAARVSEKLGVTTIRCAGDSAARIAKVAVCGGSGMTLAHTATLAGADVLVTGDIRYHEAQSALSQGLCLVDAGHFATEYPVLEPLRHWLATNVSKAGWQCDIRVAVRQADLWWGV